MTEELIRLETRWVSFLEHSPTMTMAICKLPGRPLCLIAGSTTLMLGRHEIPSMARQRTTYVLSRWVFKWTCWIYLYRFFFV